MPKRQLRADPHRSQHSRWTQAKAQAIGAAEEAEAEEEGGVLIITGEEAVVVEVEAVEATIMMVVAFKEEDTRAEGTKGEVAEGEAGTIPGTAGGEAVDTITTTKVEEAISGGAEEEAGGEDGTTPTPGAVSAG